MWHHVLRLFLYYKSVNLFVCSPSKKNLTGHGFQVLVDLIRFFSVTHVVQLSYGDTPQCHTLTSDFLRSAHGWHTHPPAQSALPEEPANQLAAQGHVLLGIHSEFEGAGTSGEM